MRDYDDGFEAGLRAAEAILRKSSSEHKLSASLTSNIAEKGGHELAGNILEGWANGIEIQANTFHATGRMPLAAS